jgi:hypothetical protein
MSDSRLSMSATADVYAPAADAYRMIADYKNNHPRIVPPKHFKNLVVEEGSGVGAGTVIAFDVVAFGTTTHARARITEPEPGRVLVENDLGPTEVVSTFTVEPLGPAKCRVTIATTMKTRTGFAGVIERALSKRFLTRLYLEEIGRIEQAVRGLI